MTTPIDVNRVHWPVDVLGPGRRVGIWVQGCSIGCDGCVSRDTWPSSRPSSLVAVPDLMTRIDALVDGQVDGVTISGGEPLDQPEALADLLTALRNWLLAKGATTDILVYTGYTESVARVRCPAAFELADAIIAGPYVAGSVGTPWWGSDNQRLIVVRPSVRARYEDPHRQQGPRVQIDVDDDGVHIIGIPTPGTLDAVERHLVAAGVRLAETSWRP